MALFTCTVAGNVTSMQNGWSIKETANGRNTARVVVLSPTGSFIPLFNDTIIIKRSAETIFGGRLLEVTERGVDSAGAAVFYDIAAIDNNELADRRYVIDQPFYEGPLKDFVALVATWCPGVTLDPAQATGPTIAEVSFQLVKPSEILKALTTASGGWLWNIDYVNKYLSMVEPGTVVAPFNIVSGDGHCLGDVTATPVTREYFNHVIVQGAAGDAVVAEDAGQIAIYGLHEVLVQASNAVTDDEMNAVASAYLARSLVIAKHVKYTTDTWGMHPNQAQTITIPNRHMTGLECLVTDVEIRHYEGDILRCTISLLEGLTYREGWRDTLLASFGGSSGTVIVSGAGGDAIAFQRSVFQLSAGIASVRSSGPTWVPASNTLVRLFIHGTTTRRVVVRIRALDPGISVRARLFDVTASTPCTGMSAIVTADVYPASPEEFNVTLTPGDHLYRLELLPGTADMDVEAIGYIS